MTISELLKKSGTYAHTTDKDRTVAGAIAEMALKKTDVLIVVSNGCPAGIFTDRDVFRCCRLYRTDSFANIKASEVMSRDIVSANPEDEIDDVLEKMLQRNVRHLPVFDSGNIAGMLNLNDLVREQLDTLQGEIRFLGDYISRLQDAGLD
jgi:CBS domain-containing protein